jgi:hypothetical protein
MFIVHHTGKPPQNKEARQHWQNSDYSYAGLGSSDLTNWARAALVLQDRGHGNFELKLSKRDKKSGATDDNGAFINSVWLRQASKPGEIFWEEIQAPEESKAERKGGKPDDKARIAAMNLHGFLTDCNPQGEGLNTISKRLESWLAGQGEDLSLRTCQRTVPLLVKNKKLIKGSDTLYRKGSEA